MWRKYFRRATAPILQGKDRYKMVLCVNCDAGMSAGKMAAQVAHGAEKAVTVMKFNSFVTWNQRITDRFMWMQSGNAKIVVAAADAEHLRMIRADAREMGISASMIRDAGLTEIAPMTTTVLALGPHNQIEIDAVTGHLRPVKEWPHPQKKWRKQKIRCVISREKYESDLRESQENTSTKSREGS